MLQFLRDLLKNPKNYTTLTSFCDPFCISRSTGTICSHSQGQTWLNAPLKCLDANAFKITSQAWSPQKASDSLRLLSKYTELL